MLPAGDGDADEWGPDARRTSDDVARNHGESQRGSAGNGDDSGTGDDRATRAAATGDSARPARWAAAANDSANQSNLVALKT
jgi:hypothetical protein